MITLLLMVLMALLLLLSHACIVILLSPAARLFFLRFFQASQRQWVCGGVRRRLTRCPSLASLPSTLSCAPHSLGVGAFAAQQVRARLGACRSCGQARWEVGERVNAGGEAVGT